MRALAIHATGASASLLEVDKPDPGPGEAVVRVAAASLNGFDVAVATGSFEGKREHRFPVVLGKDFAGTVESVGEGVSEFSVGDRVFGVVLKDFLGDGSIGEFVLIPVAVGLAHTPDGISDEVAASLGIVGVTAHAAVEAAKLSASSVVLVSGATGGVGTQVVQLAAATGATVIATARGERATDLVTGLGATEVVDYTGDVSATVRDTHPAGVDVIIHLAGDPASLVTALADGGLFVTALQLPPGQIPLEDERIVPVKAFPNETALRTVAQSHLDGKAVAQIGSVYPLDEAPAALEQFRSGKLGKIVITIP